MDNIFDKGMLDCGRSYLIANSDKKAPGIVSGNHRIALLEEGNRIPDLPEEHFFELVAKAFCYGYFGANIRGNFRIGYNGLHLGRKNHAHVHIMLPDEGDKLPRIVGLPNDTTPGFNIVRRLSNGHQYMIGRSDSKSPGLTKGHHYIAVLVDNPTSCVDLPVGTFLELLRKAHQFADARCFGEARYRIIFNGPEAGSMKHAHVHIILPEEGDSLPYLVERGNDGGDKVN